MHSEQSISDIHYPPPGQIPSRTLYLERRLKYSLPTILNHNQMNAEPQMISSMPSASYVSQTVVSEATPATTHRFRYSYANTIDSQRQRRGGQYAVKKKGRRVTYSSSSGILSTSIAPTGWFIHLFKLVIHTLRSMLVSRQQF